jgi:hypothetical protein
LWRDETYAATKDQAIDFKKAVLRLSCLSSRKVWARVALEEF